MNIYNSRKMMEISNGIKDSLNKYIYEIKEINDFFKF